MGYQNALCKKCSKIPFQTRLQNLSKDLESSQGSEEWFGWNLGSLSRLKASDCPFCKLVRSVWDDKEDTYSLPIQVYWSRSGFVIREKPRIRVSMVKEYVPGNGIFCTRKRLSSWIEFERIRRWLSRCVTGHPGCRGRDRSSLTFDDHCFRLIDVVHSCVAEPVKCERYVALSYVWGDSTD